MLVEAGEKAETVLTRDPGNKGSGRSFGNRSRRPLAQSSGRNLDPARLPAGGIAPFEHDNLESSLRQLMGGSHTGHAAAEHDDPIHRCAAPPTRDWRYR